jgi:hypothetical protein
MAVILAPSERRGEWVEKEVEEVTEEQGVREESEEFQNGKNTPTPRQFS